MTKVKEEVIDEIAILEAESLLEGLKDEEMRKNPSFLEKVRKFLKENDLKTTPETLPADWQKQVEKIPEFDIGPTVN